MKKLSPWPVLKTYDSDHLGRIALPLGGIGTGTVSLGGRGDLRDWEIMNRPAKSNRGAEAFFVLWAKKGRAAPVTRLIEGPLETWEYEGASGSTAANHGLPRFRECSFSSAYPFGQVRLSDPDVPLKVRIEAFNPFVPGDADTSGIPAAVLRYVLTNDSTVPVKASVCGSARNFISPEKAGRKPFVKYRERGGIRGLRYEPAGVHPKDEKWGTFAFAATSPGRVSQRTHWRELSWGTAILDFWDDFNADGKLEERKPGGEVHPFGSLAVSLTVPPRSSKQVTFLLAWHFPNRQIWSPEETKRKHSARNTVGNYYTTQYRDAWDVVEKTAPRLQGLEKATLRFVNAFCGSDLPDVVKEAALFNLSTLRTQTCFRTPDGRFFGWEGCHDEAGCCPGSCTHVWNYEQATAFLFPELAHTMREIEFVYGTKVPSWVEKDRRDTGHMCFRVNLPLKNIQNWYMAAADGQMGCIMKMYRDWQLSGDDDLLKRLWPKVRKCLEFCWIKGGWDADRDGVMEGCQHNTMDVEYFGPNPQMGTWYLGALRAAEEMARYLGETEFASECRRLFDNGSRWIDANLFNGEYYEHHVKPPRSRKSIAPGLMLGMGSKKLRDPDNQLGAGCLVDQLVGQYMAHVCGLGYLLKPRNVRKTLQSVLKYNRRTHFFDHFNNMRSYVLGNETALLMCSFPRGRRPARPFPYYNEVMTGFEYTVAVHLVYEGRKKQGVECVRHIRDRYDGRKRSPFDEAECGHHYARAMASWAMVPALTGFRYSGVTQTMAFAARPGTHFWSSGGAWGTCRIRKAGKGWRAEVAVLHGSLKLRRFELTGGGVEELKRAKSLTPCVSPAVFHVQPQRG